MKKQLCLLGVATVLTMGMAFGAQQQDTPQTPPAEGAAAPHRGMDPNQQLKMLTKRLQLTADQQNQILPILTDRQQQMTSMRNDSSLAQNDRREKMRGIREESESKIKAVLNDSQKQTYAQMQQHRREQMEQRRHSEKNENSGPGL